MILKQVYSTDNKKYERKGSLFQGRFKASQIHNDDHLKDLIAYVNLNYKVYKLNFKKHIVWSSYDEYLGRHKRREICWKKEFLNMFKTLLELENFT